MKNVNILRVFLASPSDVGEEREVVDQLVREVNDTLSSSKAARLELLRWETHTVPDIGTDAQNAVNQQIGDEYDIFIGILWSRFGTPTPRARSGTEEEFQRALDRKKKNPDTRVLFYFKSVNFPYDSDLNQIQLVRQFREAVQHQGLIREYNTLESFQSNVRMALTRFALGAHLSDVDSSSKPELLNDQEEEQEEEGLYELVDSANEAFEMVGRIARELSKGMEELNNRTTESTEKLDGLDIGKNPEDAKIARRVVNSFAEFMASYAAQLESKITPFREANTRAFDSILGVAKIAPEFGFSSIQPMSDNLAQLRHLKAAMAGAHKSLDQMRVNIESLPRITSPFNRSKRRLATALQSLSQEIGSGITSAEEADMLMEDVISSLRREGAKG